MSSEVRKIGKLSRSPSPGMAAASCLAGSTRSGTTYGLNKIPSSSREFADGELGRGEPKSYQDRNSSDRSLPLAVESLTALFLPTITSLHCGQCQMEGRGVHVVTHTTDAIGVPQLIVCAQGNCPGFMHIAEGNPFVALLLHACHLPAPSVGKIMADARGYRSALQAVNKVLLASYRVGPFSNSGLPPPQQYPVPEFTPSLLAVFFKLRLSSDTRRQEAQTLQAEVHGLGGKLLQLDAALRRSTELEAELLELRRVHGGMARHLEDRPLPGYVIQQGLDRRRLSLMATQITSLCQANESLTQQLTASHGQVHEARALAQVAAEQLSRETATTIHDLKATVLASQALLAQTQESLAAVRAESSQQRMSCEAAQKALQELSTPPPTISLVDKTARGTYALVAGRSDAPPFAGPGSRNRAPPLPLVCLPTGRQSVSTAATPPFATTPPKRQNSPQDPREAKIAMAVQLPSSWLSFSKADVRLRAIRLASELALHNVRKISVSGKVMIYYMDLSVERPNRHTLQHAGYRVRAFHNMAGISDDTPPPVLDALVRRVSWLLAGCSDPATRLAIWGDIRDEGSDISVFLCSSIERRESIIRASRRRKVVPYHL